MSKKRMPEHVAEAVTAAPEAVAEVVRLRREIKSLLAECKSVADDPRGHDGYEPDEVAHYIEHAHYIALTRILEGHNDE